MQPAKCIGRRRAGGKGFIYFTADGKKIRDASTIQRIRSLRIPPAWQDVSIAKSPAARIQAIGTDARNRKQYIYSPSWRQKREREKYRHMLDFVCALPAIRRHVKKDLRRPGLAREKVLALVVYLLETTLIRVGNEEYRKKNHSYGLTTFRDHHVRIRGDVVSFDFLGKSKKRHHVEIHNRKLARIMKKCRDLPGEILFQYRTPDGGRHAVTSNDVNAYLKEITGSDLTAKDFRTWAATLHVAVELKRREGKNTAELKRNLRDAIRTVSQRLGNTPAICKSSYIHPSLMESYLDGRFVKLYGKKTSVLKKSGGRLTGLRVEERTVFKFLQCC